MLKWTRTRRRESLLTTALSSLLTVSAPNYSGREDGVCDELCSVVKKIGGGGKAVKSSARQSSGGSKQPSITDMFGRG